MIDVARAPDLLVVSEGPSTFYRFATGAWPLVALGFILGLEDAPSVAALTAQYLAAWSPRAVLLGVALLILLVLLWGWRTTAHRFDRVSGTLVILRSGPVRAATRHDVSLAAVAHVVERHSGNEHAVELVLADQTTLVVARTRAGSGGLDSVARAVGDILKKPVNFARGSVIADRFEIVSLVEQGGMGVVYKALERATSETVALKLALAPIDDLEQRERFAREINVLEALDHPRIVRHLSHGIASDGRAFLAMQWLSGEDLRAALRRGPLSMQDSLQVLSASAEAIAAVHGQGIVHRDLKPGNLFLCDGRAADLVLLDFGIARQVEGATRLTGSRAIIGTPHYMAPEQAGSAAAISPAADIFSLGCIFYECLTGKHPFDAPQLVGVLARILFDNPEPVESLCPAVPAEWTVLLDRMLAKEPGRRPADGAALLAALLALPAPSTEARTSGAAKGGAAVERAFGDQVLVSVVLATLPDTSFGGAPPVDRFASIRSALHRFNCPIDRLADGSLLATVLPQHSATDQARIAASCALYLRDLLPEARISVATGRAALRRSLRVGDAVDRAVQELVTTPGADGIRVDAVTAGLLEGRFVTAQRDGSYVLIGEKQDLDESRPLLGKPTPCVGRELELLQLEGLMASAVEEKRPKAAVILGPPGIGKSRLRHELSRRLRDQRPDGVSLIGFGDPLSAGSPYVLVGDALRRHAGIRAEDDPKRAQGAIVGLCRHVDGSQLERVSEFLGELCGVPFAAETSAPLQAARGDHRVMSEQITMAFLDWLSAECRAHPVVFVLEDVQWADALTLKLLETALRNLEQAPLAILALGRPETEETFPKLFFGQRALSLSLSVLSKKASELLIQGVLGPSLSAEASSRIVRLAAGNALFLEELIRAAAEGKGGDVPETVLAMLQGRLSRLSPEARLMLRSASLFGERFWQGGVAPVSALWGGVHDPTDQLSQLVDSELIERSRVSRFPGEVEYCFRHALVCDAAYGLLAEPDRRAGHVAAGDWLEAKGETDGVVLAHHAEEGGDQKRAVLFYARAAEQSLGQYDFGEALVRSRKGIACGAEGQTLGILESVQSSAFYSMGEWPKAAELGMQALTRLPRASAWWCATVEKLMQVLPNVGKLDKSRELADELLAIEPAPEARAAYIRALHSQLLGYAVSGAHERGRRCLEFIDQLGSAASEPDVAARGYARLWRSVFTCILSTNMPLALSLSEQAIRDLSETQVLYRLSLAHIIQSFVWWGFGELERSEAAARKGRAIAEQIHDDYHAALAAWYLSVALADQPEQAKQVEAEECAWVMVLRGDNPLFEAVSRTVVARVALVRQDWVAAESEARQGRAGLANMAPYGVMASAYLMQALAQQERWEEACVIAREDLSVLARLDGPVNTSVLFRVSAAEALLGGGYRAEGESVLTQALDEIRLRADEISDPSLKSSYLTRRHENRRAAELARAHLTTPS
ncbi:MAG: protein kinase [Deltaproteobacteria bacterium]